MYNLYWWETVLCFPIPKLTLMLHLVLPTTGWRFGSSGRGVSHSMMGSACHMEGGMCITDVVTLSVSL